MSYLRSVISSEPQAFSAFHPAVITYNNEETAKKFVRRDKNLPRTQRKQNGQEDERRSTGNL